MSPKPPTLEAACLESRELAHDENLTRKDVQGIIEAWFYERGVFFDQRTEDCLQAYDDERRRMARGAA